MANISFPLARAYIREWNLDLKLHKSDAHFQVVVQEDGYQEEFGTELGGDEDEEGEEETSGEVDKETM